MLEIKPKSCIKSKKTLAFEKLYGIITMIVER